MNAKQLGEKAVYPLDFEPQDFGDAGKLPAARGYGLTKRELFAAMAMQALLDGCDFVDYPTADFDETVAKEAVRSADALLAELAKDQQ